MPIDVAQTVAEITEQFRREGDPERAEGASRYLKSDLHFVGLPVPAVRQAARKALK